MRIACILPGPMHGTELGLAAMKRREGKLRGWAFPGTEVDVVPVEAGPASIESAYAESAESGK